MRDSERERDGKKLYVKLDIYSGVGGREMDRVKKEGESGGVMHHIL